MGLNEFRPDPSTFDNDNRPETDEADSLMQSSSFVEEMNTLKIDKLSNRMTIISVILPCLIGAVLVFAYLDIKERVTDVDATKQGQYETISQQLEETINALDVKIAKNRYDLDNTLPDLEKKNLALEGQLTKKADQQTIQAQISKLAQTVTDNDKQVRAMNTKTAAAVKETQSRLDTASGQIKEEIRLFKEAFDARLLELSAYEQQIAELRKDLSLLDKKFNSMRQETVSMEQFGQQDEKINALSTQINTLDKKLVSNITRMQKDLDLLMKSIINPQKGTTSGTADRPTPQITIDSSGPVPIKEESLSQ